MFQLMPPLSCQSPAIAVATTDTDSLLFGYFTCTTYHNTDKTLTIVQPAIFHPVFTEIM